ncbi:hypothetical protein BDD12DRAFT_916364 [Trichophaea hybrida]|nr:hypothetical protein BDD12DRAFT_916364 [Trichophaea hybrida]
MLVPKSTGPLLLLLAIAVRAANNPVPAVLPKAAAPVAAGPKELPSPSTTLTGGASSRSAPPLPIKAPNPSEVNKEPGSVDAPVDGLDGKPHTGPGLFETKEKGTGDVGISGGTLHVDLKKPPPHTGDHEIVNLEDPKDGNEAKVRSSVSAYDGFVILPPGGPVPEREHKEYIQPGTDTMKDPPINAPLHLTPVVSTPDSSSISQPMHSFGLSFIMIIFSEVGDKTFLIAALMAMKHPRVLVFTAALSSLIVMSILSAVLGHAVPTLIPKHLTAFLAGGLFLVFGVKMLKEGLEMEKGTASVQHEMAEVEAELQTFVMTFLGEWGDRSQIATIAMAAGQDYWYVTIGAISGHAICTGLAVVGGRMLASRISVRNVTLGGAGAFLVFGVIYLAEALYA